MLEILLGQPQALFEVPRVLANDHGKSGCNHGKLVILAQIVGEALPFHETKNLAVISEMVLVGTHHLAILLQYSGVCLSLQNWHFVLDGSSHALEQPLELVIG